MPTTPFDRPHSVAPPAQDRAEAPGASDAGSASVWLLLGTILAAKLATVLVVLWLAWSPEAGALVAATLWFWLPVAAALLAGPALFRWRLRRVRAKRAALVAAEWSVGEDGAAPAVPATRFGAGFGFSGWVIWTAGRATRRG